MLDNDDLPLGVWLFLGCWAVLLVLAALAAILTIGCTFIPGTSRPPRPLPPVVTPPPPAPTVAPPLTIDGHVFRAGGHPWTVVGNNDHQLLERFIATRPLYETVVAERQALGFNLLRVFSTCFDRHDDGSLRACPFLYDDAYYASLRAMADDLSRRGLYLQLDVFTIRALMPDPAMRHEHWRRISDALHGATNVLLTLGNELDLAVTRIDDGAYPKPVGVLAGRGSYTGPMPPRPWWDFEEIHTNQQFQWWRKGGHNGMEYSSGTEGIPASGVPVIESERPRYPDQDSSLAHLYDSAAAAALLIAGSAYHTDRGRFSLPFSAAEIAGAQAFVAGATSVPVHCQDGRYRHDAEHVQREIATGLLRVYQRGDDPACVVAIRR